MEIFYFAIITIIIFLIPIIVMRFGKEWLIGLLPIYLITGNVFAESFVTILGIMTSLAVPIYAATFLITDLLSEHYGKTDAKRAVFVGLMGQVIFVFCLLLISNAPIFPDKQLAYKQTFAFLPRLIIGSFIAYTISQLWDIYIYHKIMNWTGKTNKTLWIRNNISTITSQFIDTTIFIAIAFYGRAPFETTGLLVNFIIATWIFKTLVASFDTIYIYISKKMYGK